MFMEPYVIIFVFSTIVKGFTRLIKCPLPFNGEFDRAMELYLLKDPQKINISGPD